MYVSTAKHSVVKRPRLFLFETTHFECDLRRRWHDIVGLYSSSSSSSSSSSYLALSSSLLSALVWRRRRLCDSSDTRAGVVERASSAGWRPKLWRDGRRQLSSDATQHELQQCKPDYTRPHAAIKRIERARTIGEHWHDKDVRVASIALLPTLLLRRQCVARQKPASSVDGHFAVHRAAVVHGRAGLSIYRRVHGSICICRSNKNSFFPGSLGVALLIVFACTSWNVRKTETSVLLSVR